MTYLHFSEKSVKEKVFGLKDVITCQIYVMQENNVLKNVTNKY